MKYLKYIYFVILTLLLSIFIGCGTNEKITSNSDNNDDPADSTITIDDLTFGTDGTFDVMTWNLENFPKAWNTASLAATVIRSLDLEVVAFQEIEDSVAFNDLVAGLNGWTGWRANSAAYDIDVAYAWSSEVVMQSIYEIYTHNSREFPRSPLVFELTWHGYSVIMINLHLKALGDNYIDESDSWDEEVRRRDAVDLLKEWIDENQPSDRVIVLGDWNDQLQDSASSNIFLSILQSDDYLFADLTLAQSGDVDQFSYPIYFSHIDHILITDELIDAFSNPASGVHTILIEDVLDGGWNEYEDDLSDHRPVAVRLDL